MVEYEQRRRRAERGIRNVGLRQCQCRQSLEQADDVIAGHADEAAGKRQTIDVRFRAGCLFERSTQHVEVFVLRRRARQGLIADTQPVGRHNEIQRVAEAQERIACETLAALDALKQEARL